MRREVRDGILHITGLSTKTLDLDKTFNCGQCFRWHKNMGGAWQGVVNGNFYIIKRMLISGEEVLVTTASEEQWANELENYFDLRTDYSALKVKSNDKFAHDAMKFGRGIRILKQDNWETLVSFIISQRNNIPKIKTTVERLCFEFGELIYQYNNKGEPSPHIYYSFPSAEVIANLSREDLDGMGLGYRDEYIIGAARAVVTNKINLDKLENPKISGDIAVSKLMELKGVGPKVANCVALFGLHKLDMFPIDVWIQRVIDTYYNGNIDIESYGKLAGLMQQYMFYYMKDGGK